MKAILVIDMPRSCAECTLRTSLEANYLHCIATLPRLKIDPMTASYIKEQRCPLRPIHEGDLDMIIQFTEARKYLEESIPNIKVRTIDRTEDDG